MKMIYGWATIDDGGFVRYATNPACGVFNPSDDQLRNHGFKPIVREDKPEAREGGEWVESCPRDAGDTIVIGWEWVESVPSPVHVSRRWTPLTIKRAADARGWWADIKQMLSSADAYEDFLMCQYIDENDPMFSPIYAALCNQFGADAVDTYLNELPTED